MKRQIGKVVLWAFVLRIFMGPIRSLLTGTYSITGVIESYFTELRSVLMNWNFLLICIGFTLLGYLVFYYFYPKRNFKTIVSIIILGAIFIIGYRYLFEEVFIYGLFGEHNYMEGISFRYHFFDNVYYLILYSILGMVIYFMQAAVHSERSLNELKNTELSFLKSQINPHFLFNNLNNIYSLIYNKSEHALDSVSKLSTMLRYSLYENEAVISLSKEWNYIEDYLVLESYRQKNDLVIEKNIDIELMKIKIAPYIFIPLIENAVKHGVLSDQDNPVIIDLYKEGENLHYSVRNKITKVQKDTVGGIGIDNLQKRLAHIYPKNHSFTIKKEAQYFEAHLIIKNIC